MSKIEHVEDSSHTSSLELDEDTFTRIEEIMDNEPEYQGHHRRWSYKRISKFLKENNYRIPSIVQERRQARKEKE